MAADFVMDLRAHAAPAFDGTVKAKILDCLHHAIHGDPRHHLRMSEVALRTAHFPYAVVRLAPHRFQVIDYRPFDPPSIFIRWQSAAARKMHRVQEFAVDVE